MTFFESIRTVFRKYADFTGRASRSEFWWFALFSALVASALGALNISTGDIGWGGMRYGQFAESIGTTLYLGSSLAGFWSVAVLLPSLAVAVRRLRDAGRRWTELFWILLPIAGAIVLVVRFAEPTVATPAEPVATVAAS